MRWSAITVPRGIEENSCVLMIARILRGPSLIWASFAAGTVTERLESTQSAVFPATESSPDLPRRRPGPLGPSKRATAITPRRVPATRESGNVYYADSFPARPETFFFGATNQGLMQRAAHKHPSR